MLYDPKWGLSFHSFVCWLETQDPAEEFSRWNPDKCAIARWLRAMGVNEGVSTRSAFEFGDKPDFGKVALDDGSTFGAALESARLLMTAQLEPTNSNLS